MEEESVEYLIVVDNNNLLEVDSVNQNQLDSQPECDKIVEKNETNPSDPNVRQVLGKPMDILFKKKTEPQQKSYPTNQVTPEIISYWADYVTTHSWKDFEINLNREVTNQARREFIRKKVRSCLTKRRRNKNLKMKRKELEIKSQKTANEVNKNDDIVKFVENDDKKVIFLDNNQVELAEDKIGKDEAIKLEKIDLDENVKFIGDGFKLIKSKVLGSDPRLRNKETFILANEDGLTLPFQIININASLPQHTNNATLQLLKNDIEALKEAKYDQRQRKHIYAYLYPVGKKSAELHAKYAYDAGKMKMMITQKYLSQSAFIVYDTLKQLMTTEKTIIHSKDSADTSQVIEYYETPQYMEKYMHVKLTIPIIDKIISEILEHPNSMCFYMLAKLLTLLLAYKFKVRNIISFPLILIPSVDHLSEFDLSGHWVSYVKRYQLVQERLRNNQGPSSLLEEELCRNVFGRNEAFQERCKTEGACGTKIVWYEFFVNRIYPDWAPMASDVESEISSDEENLNKNFKQLDHSIMVSIIEIPRLVQSLQQFTEDIGVGTASKYKDLFKMWTRQTLEYEAFAMNVGHIPRVIDIDDDTLFSVLSQNAEVRPDLIRYIDEVTSSDTDVEKADDKYYNQNPRNAISKLQPTKITSLHK